jgi:hypothetical protein
MVKIQKVLLIIIIIWMLALLGCVGRSPYYNDLDTRMFYANMKPSLENYGKKTAVFNNRIYYLSAEDGSQGIYSMLLDGTDVQPEFKVEDIRSLTVTSNGFYYSGFAHISVNDNGEYRCFQMLHRESATSDPINCITQAGNADLLKGDNVWDFYLKEDGSLYIRIARMDFLLGHTDVSISSLNNGRFLTLKNYDVLFSNIKAFDNPHQQRGLMIYHSQNQLFPVSSMILGDNESVEIFDKRNVSLFDETKDGTILPIDAIFLSDSERSDGPYSDRWILRFSDEKMLLAYETGLYEYNLKTETNREVYTFPKTESIYATYDTGSDVFLMTKTFRREGWISNKFRELFQIPDQKGENLYRLAPSTGVSVKMLQLGEGEAFLYIDGTSVATASSKTISIYDISGDKAVLLRTILVKHNIVDRANKVDTAGGWLFLYRFNEQTQRDELVEKVYIGS